MVEQKGPFDETEQTFEIGEWFRPFQNYEDMKKTILVSSPRVEFVTGDHVFVKTLGRISPVLGYRENGTGFPAIIVGASGVSFILSDEFLEAQRRISARLLTPYFTSEPDLRGFSVELQFSESGRVFTNPFVPISPINKASTITGLGSWLYQGAESERYRRSMYFPEREYNLNEVNVRIVPTPAETVVAGQV